MENFKNKLLAILGAIVFLIFIIVGFNYIENYEEKYYTKIKNTNVKKISQSDYMKYEYELDCFNKKGRKKIINFKTSRILKEGAYLLLTVKTTGVNKWEEVKYGDLPINVQEKLKNNN